MSNSKSTKEIYNELLKISDLHSVPEMNGEILIWRLYKNAYIKAYCDGYDSCIEIISDSPWKGQLTHWHPEEDEIFNYLYTLGKKGNILVLKKVLSHYDIIYIGEPDKYHLNKNQKWQWGKLIYLEQK